jgi:opacity protein-like surface antigen
MLKRHIFHVTAVLGCLFAGNAMANGFSLHVQGGASRAHLGESQTLWLNSSVANLYTTSNDTSKSSYYGLGIAYQWDALFNAPAAFRLGLTGYGLQNRISGVNTPFINAGLFDTLNYSIHESSQAVMLEPTLIYTACALQPYIGLGLGGAKNRLSHYSESPTDPNGSAVPMIVPFQDKSDKNFAYALFLGAQYTVLTTPNKDSLAIALEYRYMNWGDMELGTSQVQTSHQTLEFDALKTNLYGASVIWTFA